MRILILYLFFVYAGPPIAISAKAVFIFNLIYIFLTPDLITYGHSLQCDPRQ